MPIKPTASTSTPLTPTGCAAAFLVCRAAVVETVAVGALLVVVVVECRVEDNEELSLIDALVLLRCTLLEDVPETLTEEDVMVEVREWEVEVVEGMFG
jgi:hypothetical protein